MSVECTSHLGIAAAFTENKLSEMVFMRDGKWWHNVLVALTSDIEADRRIEAAMKDLATDYNNDNISWEELLVVGEKCSEIKLQIEQSSKE